MSAIFEALMKAAPVRFWAMIAAGPVMTAFAAALVWIVWRGGWAVDRAPQQLFYLGTALLAVLGVIAIIIVSLAAAKVKLQGPGGFGGEIESSPESPAPGAKITVTAETKSP